MEYLEGEGLDAVLRRRARLPERIVVRVGTQVLKSLIEAHACGIVHRDIKPSNLMLCKQLGEPDFVKVLDFGIARHRLLGAPESPDRPGQVMGTPRYMSPEQLMGDDVDPRSDLYSLALTLYELAVGRALFCSNQLDKVLSERLREGSVGLPDPLASSRLGAVIQRALAKEPQGRFPAAGDMLEALIATPLPSSGQIAVRIGSSLPTFLNGSDDPDARALEPTLPRLPGKALSFLSDTPSQHSSAIPLNRVEPITPLPGYRPVQSDPTVHDLEIADVVRSRFQRQLRRRTVVTGALGILVGILFAAITGLWVG